MFLFIGARVRCETVCVGGSEDNFGRSLLSYHVSLAGETQIMNIGIQCLYGAGSLKDRNEVTTEFIVHFYFWWNNSHIRAYMC